MSTETLAQLLALAHERRRILGINVTNDDTAINEIIEQFEKEAKLCVSR